MVLYMFTLAIIPQIQYRFTVSAHYLQLYQVYL